MTQELDASRELPAQLRAMTASPDDIKRWTGARARAWQAELPWLVGCNYVPSDASNQLEMWQPETFNPELCRKELGWAAGLGMNTLRVFLHDLPYRDDPAGFLERIELFLGLCRQVGIRVMLVLFDDCWYPGARSGRQPEPIRGQHNSRWLQSPGLDVATDAGQEQRLREYVQGVVGHFAQDPRVLVWDIYNENGNSFLPLLGQPFWAKWSRLIPRFLKFRLTLPPTLPLLQKAFGWARIAGAIQPLTAGSWIRHPRLNKTLHAESDVISFHNYESPERLKKQIAELQVHGRPLLCTEYLGRTVGSRFETALPIFKEAQVACYNWGLVSGKTGTIYSWEDRPGEGGEPDIWYHDILRPDGRPYNPAEVELLRAMTGRGAP